MDRIRHLLADIHWKLHFLCKWVLFRVLFFSNSRLIYTFTGYGILLINYRGSIGAGEKCVNFLLGRVGKSDVADCITAAKEALRKFDWLTSEKLVLVGGSHGGFLVTHLSGQYPTMFKVVIARNPVIDFASLNTISDIPDWYVNYY